MNKNRSEEFFRVCSPCVFSEECCVCVACMNLVKNNFPEKVKKTKDDFVDLKEASLEILASQGCESNHDEILRIIRTNQASQAVDLLADVASIMSDFIKTAEEKGLVGAEMAKAKELISRINQFLDESVKNCRKAFGEFQEPEFLKEARLTLSSELFKTHSS